VTGNITRCSAVAWCGGAHLLFNMLTFYFFGPSLERVIGTWSFLALYVLALICSEARTYLQQNNNHVMPRWAHPAPSRQCCSPPLFTFRISRYYIHADSVPIPAPVFAVCYLIYSWYLSRHGQDNVNHNAHIDGALFGLLYVAITDFDAYRRLRIGIAVESDLDRIALTWRIFWKASSLPGERDRVRYCLQFSAIFTLTLPSPKGESQVRRLS
jgi:hypothetical protein